MSKPNGGTIGRPLKDDAPALREVRRILAEHPRWSRSKAALHYAQQNPEKETQPASTARRLADKLRQESGIPRRQKALRRKTLEQLAELLAACTDVVNRLLRLERDEPD